MKKLIFAIMMMVVSAGLQAQSIKQIFVYMPDSIMGGVLTRVNRADCFDFLDSKMAAKVTNRFNEVSEMVRYTDSYLCMKMSENVTWQMKILPCKEGKSLLAVVTTVCGPACDSHVDFYTTQWEPVDGKSIITLPEKKDFLTVAEEPVDFSVRDAVKQADMLLYTISLSPDKDELTMHFTTPDYMDRETAERLKPYIKGDLHYRWENNKFVRVSQK